MHAERHPRTGAAGIAGHDPAQGTPLCMSRHPKRRSGTTHGLHGAVYLPVPLQCVQPHLPSASQAEAGSERPWHAGCASLSPLLAPDGGQASAFLGKSNS